MFVLNGNFTSREIRHNTLIKTYRDGSKQVIFATKRIFREPGWEGSRSIGVEREENTALGVSSGQYLTEDQIEEIIDKGLDFRLLPVEEMTIGQIERLNQEDESAWRTRQQENLKRALRRARVRVRDLCLCTDMRWFVTLTLDQAKIDRYDIKEITRVLNRWLSNMVEREGLAYVMVPELHQDGAVHFHAMFNDAVRVADSGTIIPSGEDRPRRPISEHQARAWMNNGGRVVYNLPQWPLGFTTALQVHGCYEKAVNYICKYISKGYNDDLGQPTRKIGGRWYYSGGKLGEPGREYTCIDPDSQLEGFGEAAHKVRLDGGLQDVDCYVVWISPEGVPK